MIQRPKAATRPPKKIPGLKGCSSTELCCRAMLNSAEDRKFQRRWSRAFIVFSQVRTRTSEECAKENVGKTSKLETNANDADYALV